jgi:hypothetical protein
MTLRNKSSISYWFFAQACLDTLIVSLLWYIVVLQTLPRLVLHITQLV